MNYNQKENTNSIKEFKNKSSRINLEMQANEILAQLDLNVDIPANLVEKVIEKKKSINIKKSSKFNFNNYLQIAAVFAAAICIGVVMGKNADTSSFNKKQNKEKQALIELKKRHHLSDFNSFGRF